jgi:hypothetical protein
MAESTWQQHTPVDDLTTCRWGWSLCGFSGSQVLKTLKSMPLLPSKGESEEAGMTNTMEQRNVQEVPGSHISIGCVYWATTGTHLLGHIFGAQCFIANNDETFEVREGQE